MQRLQLALEPLGGFFVLNERRGMQLLLQTLVEVPCLLQLLRQVVLLVLQPRLDFFNLRLPDLLALRTCFSNCLHLLLQLLHFVSICLVLHLAGRGLSLASTAHEACLAAIDWLDTLHAQLKQEKPTGKCKQSLAPLRAGSLHPASHCILFVDPMPWLADLSELRVRCAVAQSTVVKASDQTLFFRPQGAPLCTNSSSCWAMFVAVRAPDAAAADILQQRTQNCSEAAGGYANAMLATTSRSVWRLPTRASRDSFSSASKVHGM